MNVYRLIPIIAVVAWASGAIATPAAPKLHLHKPARGFQKAMGRRQIAALVEIEIGPAPGQPGHGGKMKDRLDALERLFK